MNMGSSFSCSKVKHPEDHGRLRISELEQQVADVGREVQKQKELRIMYQKRMENIQDYVRYCLQIAQANGFLHLIIADKDSQQGEDCCLTSPVNGNTRPPLPSLDASVPSQQSDLAVIIAKAQTNGWFIDPTEVELHEKVGQGSTADIYRAIWRGLDVAVKCIHPNFFHTNQNGVAFFAQELDTLSRQRHPFVLQLMGACLEPPNYAWVVTELLSMTLKEWLHGAGNNNRAKERVVPLPKFQERVARALEIAQAMQYLHEQKPKLIHRDLKPSNIFLDEGMHVRVADFGHARFLKDDEFALTGEIGTFVYMAPEVIRCEPYNEKCDVYSFGVILNELITGDNPYIETDYSPTKIALEVGEGKLRPALPEDNGNLGELIKITTLSWDQDPSIRPSFSEITSGLRKFKRKLTIETMEEL